MNSDRRGFFKKLLGLAGMVVAAPMLPEVIKPITVTRMTSLPSAAFTFTYSATSACSTAANAVWKSYYPYEVK